MSAAPRTLTEREGPTRCQKLNDAHANFQTYDVVPDGSLLAIDVTPYSVSGVSGSIPQS